VIALDDPRWTELQGARGSAGEVARLLQRLELDPDDEELFSEVHDWLCRQGDSYPASYAAVPHLVRIGARASRDRAAHYWALVGVIATDAVRRTIAPSLRSAYDQALHDADAHIRAAVTAGPRDYTIWYLLSAAAAIRGLDATASALEDFVNSLFDVDCPSCHEMVEIAREDTLPGPPLASRDPGEWRWTDDDAPARLLALARAAHRPDVEAVLVAWDGTAQCPLCDAPFRVRPAQLATIRAWAE